MSADGTDVVTVKDTKEEGARWRDSAMKAGWTGVARLDKGK